MKVGNNMGNSPTTTTTKLHDIRIHHTHLSHSHTHHINAYIHTIIHIHILIYVHPHADIPHILYHSITTTHPSADPIIPICLQ